VTASSFDPQNAVAQAKRRLASVPAQLADGFARLVRRTPDRRLERLMSVPARRVILDGIFWQMPQHLDRRQAAQLNATIQWCITGRTDGVADNYRLSITDSRCSVKRGVADPDASVTITITGAEFIKLAAGVSNPMQAYFSGRIALAGDIMLAAKLQSLFRIPAGIRDPA
jgi:putative sterol carrier protein